MQTKVTCELCPKACEIAPGESGECRIRVNIDGQLRAVTYGFPVTAHVDPVEKKPFFHYHPGQPILSFATARAGLDAGIKTAIVSASYANPDPLRKLYRVVDAATVDVKAFDDAFYREVCGGGLAPVLNGLVIARSEGVWLEVSNLVVPGMNDSVRNLKGLSKWVVENLGVDTPLHFLRFYPQYRMKNIPPTPVETLERARNMAMEAGLHYVYIDNVPGSEAENTYCPHCGRAVIKRVGYHLRENHVRHGKCEYCATPIAGRFD